MKFMQFREFASWKGVATSVINPMARIKTTLRTF